MRMVGQERLDNMMRTVARSERLWARIKKGLRVQSSIEATLEKIMRCAYLATFFRFLAGWSLFLAGWSLILVGWGVFLAGWSFFVVFFGWLKSLMAV